MRSGSYHLRIASMIQIAFGICGLLLTYFLIGAGDVTITGLDPETAFKILILTYAGYAFQILAGIVGLIQSNKKSLLTLIFGILLFVPYLIMFIHTKENIIYIIINAITLAFPYYYLHNAYKNFKY